MPLFLELSVENKIRHYEHSDKWSWSKNEHKKGTMGQHVYFFFVKVVHHPGAKGNFMTTQPMNLTCSFLRGAFSCLHSHES